MEKMSDTCHFPSGDPIHTKPMEHALCMKAGPSTLAKASGIYSQDWTGGWTHCTWTKKTYFGCNTGMGLIKLGRGGIPIR